MVYRIRLVNTRILQGMISGIPLLLGLGNRMSDPYVCIMVLSALTRSGT